MASDLQALLAPVTLVPVTTTLRTREVSTRNGWHVHADECGHGIPHGASVTFRDETPEIILSLYNECRELGTAQVVKPCLVKVAKAALCG